MAQRDKELPASARLLLFQGERVALNGSELLWPAAAAKALLAGSAPPILLEDNCFVAEIGDEAGHETRSLRSLLFSENDAEPELLSRAGQLLHWQRSHRYCGCCGESTRHGENERVLECPACAQQFFPRINPCVIMLVTRGEEVLLARSARYRSGFYSCLAGFVEVGETPEQTVAREVREEVGVEVENIRYVESQSWPFPSQLMLGFLADFRSGEIVPEPEEIEAADWFPVGELPNVPPAAISVAGKLIEHYANLRLRQVSFSAIGERSGN